VVKNGDHALMVSVVVKKVTVVLHLNSVLLKKDVKKNTVYVLKIDVEKNGEHVQKDNVVVKMVIVAQQLNIVL